MGRVVNLLKVALEEIKADGNKKTEQQFMMNAFDELHNDLKLFADYRECMCTETKCVLMATNKLR